MLIKKCSKSINLCINLVFIVFILEINLYILLGEVHFAKFHFGKVSFRKKNF